MCRDRHDITWSQMPKNNWSGKDSVERGKIQMGGKITNKYRGANR